MSKRVLIVEDNQLNMKLFQDLLEAHGIETVETSDGNAVLGIAREHKPDLILMDIQLPEVSGLEVTKRLKEDSELRSIPVIAVTAFAMKGDEQKIRDGGCEDYISKPISVMGFIETVQKHLEGTGEETLEEAPKEAEDKKPMPKMKSKPKAQAKPKAKSKPKPKTKSKSEASKAKTPKKTVKKKKPVAKKAGGKTKEKE